MLKSRLLVAATALSLSALVFAHGKQDDAVDYRMGLMTVIGWNFGPLGAMVKGKAPFDAADFSKHADRVAFLSDQIVEGFPKGSDKGHTDAKPEIWANWDDFQAKAKDFNTQAKLLADVAKANDEAKDKEQFKKVAETCKACHEKYKKD
ncbi:MAG: cytochrome c [Rudaea sp.]|uniref:c-type cytochrome n=1 Tax=unclassified Rudaea TaxID=2627037 RepID=UPI0010F9D5CF|nr:MULTISPECIES: cytochrome c [unclassified Rudaea]MBN8884288.1 cytochrome c [Rudaea sp.]MBR0345299.1 cytochrome c [Rudaea sp.]